MSSPPALILASTSRYRAELLSRLRLPFETAPPGIDESPRIKEDGSAMCVRLAMEKARAVAKRFPDAVVIGSDQCAIRGEVVLGKPGDSATARQQLLAASGRCVEFRTAVCVREPAGNEHALLDVTRVRFRELGVDEVQRYVETEQPLDCAGSFKVEGLGISLFDAVESRDPTALIGLPLIQLADCLRRLGYALP
ncbi:MAG: septum formation protein Maf [Xanthomonadales bacterium]|nr:septum formation protein Maf [Xanthomonadales bacterium]